MVHLIISRISIKDKKNINSIELHFDEKIKKYLINKEGESSNYEDSPSFIVLKASGYSGYSGCKEIALAWQKNKNSF